jgi:hypothetical protein
MIPALPASHVELATSMVTPIIVSSAARALFHERFEEVEWMDEEAEPTRPRVTFLRPQGNGGYAILSQGETSLEWGASVGFGIQPPDVSRYITPGAGQAHLGGFEILWAAVPYLTSPEIFRGRKVIHFLSDPHAVRALVSGYEKMVGAGMIVNALHAHLMGLDCEVTWAHAPYAENVAALLAEEEFEMASDALEAAGVPPRRVEWENLPTLPSMIRWQKPVAEWLASRAGSCE